MRVKINPKAPIQPRYRHLLREQRPAMLVSRTPKGDAYVAFAVTDHRWSTPVLVEAEYIKES